ncbi:MAG: response regulator [Methylotenera sp.]|nr:response regulator [Methylotenera sp.]
MLSLTDQKMVAPTVFVVDDDKEMRNSLRRLLMTMHLNVELYSSAQEFMEHYKPEWPGCIILDMRMPRMGGLDLLAKLVEQGVSTPVIIATGHGDVPSAVRAMKGGAFGFIEKPFDEQELLDCVNGGIALDHEIRQEAARRKDISTRMAQLTARELEVLELIISGKTNKIIATELNVSCKTVEAHRSRVMRKMQADSVANLAQLYFTSTALSKRG